MIKLIAQLRKARTLATAALLCSVAPQWTAAQTIGIAPPTNGMAAPAAPQGNPSQAFSQLGPHPITHAVTKPVERVEMIVNTSRILTQEQKIPQAQVNNPEVLGLTALSANQIQIYGRRPGVTQVNIWDEKGNIHSIDVMVYGDVQELARLLQDQFPKAALKLTPISTGVLIQGYVDDPNVQSRIVELAQAYYPNVINAITIGGVQQVLLQVRVLEVSRTKLQSLGIDMAAILENGSFFASGAAGLLRTAPLTAAGTAATSGVETLAARVSNNGDNFFFFVEALKRNNLAKIMADPNLTTVSGRPAFMNAGGEFPIAVPQSLGTISIEYRRFGTQIDFVPIVLGNGVIRLEVRPRVSEIDDSRSIVINGQQVPGLRVREADTAAELRAGQTLVVAGLVQTRSETSVRGVPWIMDTPYIGTFFRRTSEQLNEIELLIMVTPQLVDGLDPQDLCQIGPGPGTVTTNPGDVQLMHQGHIEVIPDRRRPAHFQQPFPIGAQGGAAAGSSGPTGMMTEAPPLETLPPAPQPKINLNPPASQPNRAPQANPTPPSTGVTPPTKEAASQLRIRPATQSRELVPQLPQTSYPQVSAPPGQATTIRSLPAVPSLPSDPASPPGMIGPIGYEK
jgi:pilus assembly protein CpaC